ncbi:class I SAM-dependent methyltransferase [Pseudonocardia sp. DSM 110487]|uniref:class I SAM-dependent methyltransferase n=1 Tax=Pseudonocardia sp. DSM 110487 TaxID=2865833 RepID=UPI001C69F936|nr:class I SAM-dependent methyltransferase [Pseudonocardia sp. DSM 110487]QYN35688.1 class I SAM-dependent methyltransferase [Pseudonocardia sp. DSM 110487]
MPHRHHEHDYLPAMTKDWLLPLYDPMTRLLGVQRIHRRLIELAAVEQGHRVLEIGCGPGGLVLRAQRMHPDAEVVGLDPDPLALARARRKAERAGLPVRFDQGKAGELPYPDESIDRVLSSFMFHHLDDAEKRRALAEVRRVLRPGGRLHLVDIAGHHHGPFGRRMQRNEHLRDNAGDGIPDRMREAGLSDVRTGERGRLRTTFYRASR